MKKIVGFLMLSMILLLGACNKEEPNTSGQGSVSDGEPVSGSGAIDHGVDDKQVGFNLSDGSIEEATGIPDEEKEQILNAFNTYIETFNQKDIDSYMNTLSDDTESFNKEEERIYMDEVFAAYDLGRETSDVTIVKYSDKEAQVFANMKTSMRQIATGLETNPSGRQVTVFTKDNGEWKVAAIHYIGNETQQ